MQAVLSFLLFSFLHHWLLFEFLPSMATNDLEFEVYLLVSEWDFYRNSMVFDYCLLPVIDFNITCHKIFFFPYIFLLLFCSFAPTCICFSFSFLFSLSFPFFCVDIFKLFNFNSHKLSFVKLSIHKIQKKSCLYV